ncbi:MAG: NADH-quinone oxidoreductase subunit J [Nitrospinota bacterium]|nr:MAG: NADH-quinone oxidoreductase subunit J [Nitrospinota bacterium]
MEFLLFSILAVLILITSMLVILHRNPIYSALFLIVSFLLMAGLFLLLNAQFLAVVQVIIYAGAIMVLFLFVLMLLDVRQLERAIHRVRYQRSLGLILGLLFFLEIGLLIRSATLQGEPGAFSPEKVQELGNIQILGKLLFTDYLYPFEMTSLLLLVAIIGAVLLARRE